MGHRPGISYAERLKRFKNVAQGVKKVYKCVMPSALNAYVAMNPTLELREPGNGFTIAIEPCSGQVKPFQGVVFDAEGNYVGRTGFCGGPYKCELAAKKLMAAKK